MLVTGSNNGCYWSLQWLLLVVTTPVTGSNTPCYQVLRGFQRLLVYVGEGKIGLHTLIKHLNISALRGLVNM